MTEPQMTPESFPVPPDRALIHRRAAFSHSSAGLTRHYVDQESSEPAQESMRRRMADESLRLIDDLTNRPMDPMFEDARLLPAERRSPLSVWINRILVFVICVLVGLAGTGVVQVLHRDPRQKVREKLISQVETVSKRADDLNGQISDLNSNIDTLSAQEGGKGQNRTQTADDLTNATSKVQGQGIVITLANPIASKDARDNADQIKLITDQDLQWFLSKLWSAGAEAIAINGNRIGTQTSVRTAGQTILVGTASIEAPYKIEAIGDQGALADLMARSDVQGRLRDLKTANITVNVVKQRHLNLNAVSLPNLSYAGRSH
ncbi:DUF881 domain-containing protein [Bifidobacterium sp. ESL0819]|uniref:DUF881 domain-containing protein n=1 Tax=Bifidobacterium sp. ESL0819 TaxID=3448589 RepID=UPI004042DED5